MPPAGEEVVPRREGLAFSPSAGVVWQPAGPVRLHAAAQRAFRRPTLNELYRPFRVGNVITDANPYLRTETVTSAEIGATVTRGAFTFDATAFWNDLHDAVANVTLAQGPVTLPGIGFVPAGGEGRRRLNLDRTRVEGVALSAQWRISPALAADARYLWDDTTVTRATVATPLEGLRLAQVPLHSVNPLVHMQVPETHDCPDAPQMEVPSSTLPLQSSSRPLHVSAEMVASHAVSTPS